MEPLPFPLINTLSLQLPAKPCDPFDDEDELPAAADNNEDSSDDSNSSSDEEQQDWTELFPNLQSAIQSAIRELGGKVRTMPPACHAVLGMSANSACNGHQASHQTAPSLALDTYGVCFLPAFGLQVVPKLNWSCPSDATWVNPLNSLSCDNADEVVLMLKSSDRVAHDLELLASTSSNDDVEFAAATSALAPDATNPAGSGPGEGATPSQQQSPQPQAGVPHSSACGPSLVLRKWYDLRPEREWRCFVRGRQLLAVCQRDCTQHFPQLAASTMVQGGNDSGTDTGSDDEGGSQRAQAARIEADQPVAAEVVEAVQLLAAFFCRNVSHKFPLQNCGWWHVVQNVEPPKSLLPL